MSEYTTTQSTTYTAGYVTAYGAAKRGGYTGSYADFCAAIAGLADTVADLEEFSVIINTLSPGTQATASYADGVLTLGVPQGAKGDKGDKGDTGEVSQEELDEAVNDLKADLNKTNDAIINKQYISGSNLFNKDDAGNTDGTWINSAGNITTGSSSYGLSDYIPVTAGLTYAYKSRQGGTKNAWYDVNKTKLSVFSNETGHPIIATAPDGAYYVRLTYGIAEKNATQFNQSETLLPYSAYTEYAVETELRKLTKINPDDYAKSSAVDSKVDKTITSVNLFNKNASGIVADHYLNASGSEAGSTSYSISDYIPVTPGKTYGYSSRSGGAYNWFYDENKTIIPGARFDCNNMPKIVTAPSGAAFIRLSFGNAEKDTTMFAEGDTVPAYVPYYEIDSQEQIKKVYNSDINASGQAISMVGTSGIIVKSDTLSADGTLNVTSFPYYLKKNVGMSFYGKFSAFTGLRIGKGYNSYRGDWIAIDTTNVVFHHYESADQTKKTVAHGLTFSDYIMVNLYFDEDCDIIVKIDTVSGSFTTKRETDSNVFSGIPFVTALSAMTNVQLSIQSGDLRKPLWVIGDSYFGVTSDRVLGQLKALGYWNGYAADGLAGLGSAEAYNELQRMLSFGKPKFLVWYLGMNDSDTTFTTYLANVIEVCQTNDIVLILNKVPTVPQRDKETIGAAVVASGKRYIDSYAAVGANSSGDWYTGFIETATNPVHPTVRGAEALAQRFVNDVPEIMMYGYNEAEVTGLSVGDN